MLKCPDLAIYHMAPLLGANSKHSKQWVQGWALRNMSRHCSGAPISHGAVILLYGRVLHKISFGGQKEDYKNNKNKN